MDSYDKLKADYDRLKQKEYGKLTAPLREEITRLRGIESLARDFVSTYRECMELESDAAERDMDEARRLLIEAFPAPTEATGG